MQIKIFRASPAVINNGGNNIIPLAQITLDFQIAYSLIVAAIKIIHAHQAAGAVASPVADILAVYIYP